MRSNFGLFVVGLYLSSLVQVSVIAIPFGILLILLWYLLNDIRHLVPLLLLFSLFLASLSNMNLGFVLLASSLSVAVFIISRDYLPHKLSINTALAVFTLLVWETLMFTLIRL